MSQRRYPGKLLLIGEYTVIKGGPALAIPLPFYASEWRWISSPEQAELQQSLYLFREYLVALHASGKLLSKLDLSAFKTDLDKGLYFHSDIPRGYGAGSSGALCAGVYDRYLQDKELMNPIDALVQIKESLAQMESFFHGSSSGIDPLVCYINQPLLFRSSEEIHLFKYPAAGENTVSLFLIDTALPRETGPLVKLFLEKCQDPYFAMRLETQLIPYTEEAIHCIKTGKVTALKESFHQISYFQYKYLLPMIPLSFRNIWLDGLNNNIYKLKLCGAGGGGFILGFTTDFTEASVHLRGQIIKEVLKIG